MAYSLPVMNVLHGMVCKWSNDVSDSEFRALIFIFLRTYYYDKEIEKIPTRHFMHGVFSNGKCIMPGIRKSKRQVLRILDNLEDIGAISKKAKPGQPSSYRIQLREQNRIIRNARTSDTGDTHDTTPGVTHVTTTGDTHDTTYIKCNKKNGIKQNGGSRRESGVCLMDTSKLYDKIAKTEQRAKEERDRKKKKASATSFWYCWNDAMQTYYKDIPSLEWNKKTLGMANQILRRGLGTTDLEDFCDVVVGNWDYIRSSRFAWAKDAPITPNIQFVFRFIDKFVEVCYEIKTVMHKRTVNTNKDKPQDIDRYVKEAEKLRKQLDQKTKELEDYRNSVREKKGREIREAKIIDLSKLKLREWDE